MPKRNRRRPNKTTHPNYQKLKMFSRISKGNWGIAIGAILMFVSWVSQNIYISKLEAHKSQLRADNQFMNTEIGTASQWLLKYQEELRKKPKYDPEVIANTAKRYSFSMEQILGVAKRMNPQSTILADHHTKIIKDKKRIEEAFEYNDVEKIIEISNELMQWADKAYYEAIPEFNSIEDKINSSNILWTRIFRISYITASCLLAVSWICVNGRSLLGLKKLNK